MPTIRKMITKLESKIEIITQKNSMSDITFKIHTSVDEFNSKMSRQYTPLIPASKDGMKHYKFQASLFDIVKISSPEIFKH